MLTLAAYTNIVYHLALSNFDHIPAIVPYALRFLYHQCLFINLECYIFYIEYTMQLLPSEQKAFPLAGLFGLIGFGVIDILGTVFGFGFRITDDFRITSQVNLFLIEYLFFVGIALFMIVKFRDRVYKPIIGAFILTIAIALILMYIQGLFNQQSFTTSTFVFPALSVLYLLHSNPYDLEMGSLKLDSFESDLQHRIQAGKKFAILSILLHEFEAAGHKYPKEMRDIIRSYVEGYFNGAALFQITGGRMEMVVDLDLNPDYKERTKQILDVFHDHYNLYKYDYKIIIVRSEDGITNPDDYIALIQYVENRMPENQIKYVDEDILNKFSSHKYIVDELNDINEKQDLNDDRVLVYCQPVYNLRTGRYDTAEALMRLTLPQTGMVYPDRFIPIAEKHNCIHMLSLIILAKTCKQIRKMLNEGYVIKRISVNFSILDIREKEFSQNVQRIVNDCGIPMDKIAIEITESQNQKDFDAVKETFRQLKSSGITFYLDDFGTGYSNFERIMELPFDIIKFDRSLVMASRSDSKSETMVSYLAHMFTDMNYSVLYEGIEYEEDEKLCTQMYARYLQGYKYAKPIPIQELDKYFVKASHV
ncbi:MAG: EAL domain-containing protein [Butyrivibrio sp.]|nr:EAL domain-containing protein [Butyrivibrio sp.]